MADKKSALKCSFCCKEVGLSDLYRSAHESATQAQICSECLDVCRQILRQEYGTGLDAGGDVDKRPVEICADFNGIFGELLCISHGESCSDEFGRPVSLGAGMKLTAYDEDVDDNGNPYDLIALGTVEPAPSWLRCNGSRWVLKIDENGVRHQSEIGNRKRPPGAIPAIPCSSLLRGFALLILVGFALGIVLLLFARL